jgi:TRAP-type uncharacterized transport system substrate-binding protein
MADVAGTIRSVTLGGLPFNAKADASLSVILTGWENSRIPHSGGSMRKMIKRVRTVEGVVLTLGGTDRDNLKRFAESSEDITLAFEDAAGNNYHAQGSIEFEIWETEENNCNLTMQAENEWTFFAA